MQVKNDIQCGLSADYVPGSAHFPQAMYLLSLPRVLIYKTLHIRIPTRYVSYNIYRATCRSIYLLYRNYASNMMSGIHDWISFF